MQSGRARSAWHAPERAVGRSIRGAAAVAAALGAGGLAVAAIVEWISGG
jgi:hypothetical protein